MSQQLCPICIQPLEMYDHKLCRLVADERRAKHKPMTPAQIEGVKAMFKGSANIKVTFNYKTLPNGLELIEPKSRPARKYMLDSLDELYIVPAHNQN